MKKIVTENPKGMVEHAHNFVFVKNKEVYVRLVDKEMTLVEYIRKMDKEIYGIEHDDRYCNALEFGEYMDDDRFTCDMYHVLVGFAEVREYLKYYEDRNSRIIKVQEWDMYGNESNTKYFKSLNKAKKYFKQLIKSHKGDLAKDCLGYQEEPIVYSNNKKSFIENKNGKRSKIVDMECWYYTSTENGTEWDTEVISIHLDEIKIEE